MKLKGKQAEEQIKLQSMQEKLKVDHMKNQMDLQKMHQSTQNDIVKSLLTNLRGPVTNGQNGGTQNGQA